MKRALAFEDLQAHLLAAAAGARLEIFGVKVLQDLVTFDRLLSFSVAPSRWRAPYKHRAEVSLTYRALHAVLAQEPGRRKDEEDTALEVDVEYVLLEADVPLAQLERRVRPLVARLNEALGGEPRKVYYTVATDYAGAAHAVLARVLDLHTTSVLEGSFDGSFMDSVGDALRSLKPQGPG